MEQKSTSNEFNEASKAKGTGKPARDKGREREMKLTTAKITSQPVK